MATTTTMPQPLPLPSARGHKFLICVSPVLPVSSRGHKFSTCVSPFLPVSLRGHKFSTCGIRRPPRPAFTLVELLVVIGIIAMLAAIITPAVMRAQASARNAAIKAEIDMLHMAIMNYKNEYGSFPPCADTTTNYAANGPAARHLARLFPRCTDPTGTTASGQFYQASALTPATALVAWLSGFTDDPTSPLRPPANRNKLFDFDQSRIASLTYFPSGKSDSPYVYVNSSLYSTNAYTGGSAGAMRQTYAGDATPFYNTGSETNDFFNADTFQILCAGRDEQFGTDDDLSNFWPGTRRDYLDSLNQ